MSGEFEELFQRVADMQDAPPIIRWMIQRRTFSTLEFARARGITDSGGNSSIKNYERRGWIRKIVQGYGRSNPSIYEWVGTK